MVNYDYLDDLDTRPVPNIVKMICPECKVIYDIEEVEIDYGPTCPDDETELEEYYEGDIIP